jgi:hypothetical protein
MRIPIGLFPLWIINQYDLMCKVHNGHIYMEIRRTVWGLPQAGILANKLLQKRLLPHECYECKQTPSLWKHTTRPISFTLVVNNFSVKYERQEDIDHLIKCVQNKYQLTKDWTGNLNFGINLK